VAPAWPDLGIPRDLQKRVVALSGHLLPSEVSCLPERPTNVSRLGWSGRPGGCPPGPPQSRTCRFPASGSSGQGFATRTGGRLAARAEETLVGSSR
jgi:hypothetical protein